MGTECTGGLSLGHMFHPESLVVKCFPPYKWARVGKRQFLNAKRQFFQPLEDMALCGKLYSMTKFLAISWQWETNMVFERGSNMISAGLCEINLAAM